MKKNKTKWSHAEMNATAHHESGHAVVKLVLGYPFDHVWYSWSDRNCAGKVVGPSARYVEHNTARELHQNARQCIICSYAGLAAEKLADPDAPECHGDADEKTVSETCRDCDYYPDLERLRREAQRLVRENEQAIRHLATVTLERLGKTSDEMVLSVDEIKMILSGIPVSR